jgi:hypothetical protein
MGMGHTFLIHASQLMHLSSLHLAMVRGSRKDISAFVLAKRLNAFRADPSDFRLGV